ncbi:hypothetical protein M6B38_417535 [Iris pallida]|uniref:Uncharacterized protein n=1 Tax=Iris pallida TaxID=29817 RepID=A0AAX6FIE1_IRIPA|nr:hypothetical protein M6B38_417535 [Iris pallida]
MAEVTENEDGSQSSSGARHRSGRPGDAWMRRCVRHDEVVEPLERTNGPCASSSGSDDGRTPSSFTRWHMPRVVFSDSVAASTTSGSSTARYGGE